MSTLIRGLPRNGSDTMDKKTFSRAYLQNHIQTLRRKGSRPLPKTTNTSFPPFHMLLSFSKDKAVQSDDDDSTVVNSSTDERNRSTESLQKLSDLDSARDEKSDSEEKAEQPPTEGEQLEVVKVAEEKSENDAAEVTEAKTEGEQEKKEPFEWPEMIISPLPFWQDHNDIVDFIHFSNTAKAFDDYSKYEQEISLDRTTSKTSSYQPFDTNTIKLPVLGMGQNGPGFFRPRRSIPTSDSRRQHQLDSASLSVPSQGRGSTQSCHRGFESPTSGDNAQHWLIKTPTTMMSPAKFKSKHYVETPYGNGLVLNYNHDDVTVQLEHGGRVTCKGKQIELKRVVAVPDLTGMNATALTPTSRHHGMNMLFSSKSKIRNMFRPQQLVGSAHERSLTSLLPSGIFTKKQEEEGPQVISKETWANVQSLQGAERIPASIYWQRMNLLQADLKDTFVVPSLAPAPKIKIQDRQIFIDKVGDIKVVMQEKGLQPVYNSEWDTTTKSSDADLLLNCGMSNVLCGAHKKHDIDPNTDLDRTTMEMMKAPGILQSGQVNAEILSPFATTNIPTLDPQKTMSFAIPEIPNTADRDPNRTCSNDVQNCFQRQLMYGKPTGFITSMTHSGEIPTDASLNSSYSSLRFPGFSNGLLRKQASVLRKEADEMHYTIV